VGGFRKENVGTFISSIDIDIDIDDQGFFSRP
jgi:hypothetical protein